jgi:hypothetical protein
MMVDPCWIQPSSCALACLHAGVEPVGTDLDERHETIHPTASPVRDFADER